MASLLQTDATGLNEYAKKHEVIYPIASRCGVFAKTDIQPLINDGAKKEIWQLLFSRQLLTRPLPVLLVVNLSAAMWHFWVALCIFFLIAPAFYRNTASDRRNSTSA